MILPFKRYSPLVHITFGENSVTNQVETADDYRTPLPSKGLSYELTGLTVPVGRTRFTLDDLLVAATNATSIAYEQSPTPGTVQKRIIEHVRTLYRRNDLTGLLTLGQLESLALPGEAYKLAFTPGLLTEVYGGRVTDSMVEGEGRYVHSEGDSQWWIPSGLTFFSPGPSDTAAQEVQFARQHFFAPHRYRDPFHTDQLNTETVVAYDPHTLLVTETTDAVENRVTVANDYRVLGPRLMTDPNGNRSEVRFDTLGMVAGTAVMGKATGQAVGDLLDASFQSDLTQAQLDAFFANPRQPSAIATESEVTPIVHELLRNATSRIVYDLDRFQRLGEPPVAATIVRETHVSDLAPGAQSKLQVSVSYSDGFGREIQKKIQAEPGPVVEGGPVVSPRWVGSGWTIFNNKGKPVRQYEPFFSDTHLFEFGVQVGVSPILFYDPVERVVATLHANHTYEKVVFDPWRQTTFDVNDTVAANGAETGDPRTDADIQGYTAAYFASLPASPPAPAWQTWYQERITGDKGPQEKNAAEKSAKHANTPSVAHLDTLGCAFLTIADNRLADGTEQWYETRVELDIEGNQRAVTDALNRKVMTYDYDMLGTKIHQLSMDAGARWMLTDAAGKPMRAWDSRDHQFRTTYDQLQRPLESHASEGAGSDRLVGRTVYGETQLNPEANNLRGKPVQLFDEAGVVASDDYDFKGNLLSGNRQLLQNYKDPVNWSQSPTLETQTFSSSTDYDALNRPVTVTTPDGSVMRPTYNEANLLEQMHVNLQGIATSTPFVTGIDYNAKGQRKFIEYGNGARTEYSYDDQTFRLINLQTTRTSDNALLQDLSYTYDPVGNITSIRDDAQQTIYFNGQVVSPSTNYEYDSLYRLTRADGREHAGQASNNVPEHRPEFKPHYDFNDSTRKNLPHPNDGHAMRNYTERYDYDEVGNILRMIHQAGDNGSWTRGYRYAADSNRLFRTSLPIDADEEPYSGEYDYDAHGNMTRMPHLSLMQWDNKDQLRATSKQVVSNGGPAEITYYVYDASGQRVRKVTETHNGSRKDERIYVGGFERYRKYNGNGQTITLERETLHVMDDKRRIALVDTRTIEDSLSLGERVRVRARYQFDNHLGSASLELDDAASIISYEEYHPYGTTSYEAGRNAIEVSLKRYRYTGKERDDETGLSYHGARYYAPWLGRWTAADPSGISDGLNVYCYARNNPIIFHDPSGTENKPVEKNDKAIMLMTDPQLYRYLKDLEKRSPNELGKFSEQSGGWFRKRAEAMINKYGMKPEYPITITTKHSVLNYAA